MFTKPFRFNTTLLLLSLTLLFGVFAACSSSPQKVEKAVAEKANPRVEKVSYKTVEKKKAAKAAVERNKGSLIEIKEDSPADTVRVFYKRLREKNFRDAIMLTNLRPAIEGLTDAEMKDLGVDFGFLAKSVPSEIPINGEIVTGKLATVTVKLKNEDTEKIETQEIKLRKRNENWILLIADKKGEAMARKEGKNYFFALRMDVHHKEAKAMLDRIGKAQMIYSMKFGGKFTDMETLVKKGFVPTDAKDSKSTGYKYEIILASDRTTYSALATPAAYGKSGKLSFALKITREAQPELVGQDVKGKPLLN